MNIYLKLTEQPETIEELLKALFSVAANHNDRLLNIETYYDKECTKIQCIRAKFRSFEDIFDIVNTYFPNTSEEDVMKSLLFLKLKSRFGSRLYFYPTYCRTICRPVCLYYENIMANPFNNKKAEEGKILKSWKDLLSQIGIKTDAQFSKAVM